MSGRVLTLPHAPSASWYGWQCWVSQLQRSLVCVSWGHCSEDVPLVGVSVIRWGLRGPITRKSDSEKLPEAFVLLLSWVGLRAGQPGFQKAKNNSRSGTHGVKVWASELFCLSVELTFLWLYLNFWCVTVHLYTLVPVQKPSGRCLLVPQPTMALVSLPGEGNGSCQGPAHSHDRMQRTVGLQLYTCMQTLKCCGIGVMIPVCVSSSGKEPWTLPRWVSLPSGADGRRMGPYLLLLLCFQ